jgi:hypothetical protein
MTTRSRNTLGGALLALLGCAAPAPVPPPPPLAEPASVAAPHAASSASAPTDASGPAALCLATANAVRAKFSGEPERIVVRHVLVRYRGARNAPADTKRSRAEACLRAMEVRDKVREGADFVDLVKTYSEEAGAASREGVVGPVERKDLAKQFADAAFELAVNQLSDVVETDAGFHVILRRE